MSRIIVPSRRIWTRQPQRPVKVSGSGLSKDVVFAAVAGQPESISGVLPIPIGTSSFNVTKQGRGLYSPSTTAGGWYWPVSPSHPIYSISTQHTIIVFGRLDSIISYGCIFGIPYEATWKAPYYAISIAGSTTATTAAAAASVTTSLNNATIASALVTGQDTSFAVVRDGESGAFYRGGGLLGALTWGNGGAINLSNKQLPTLFNRSSKSADEGAKGSAVAVLVFKRALSAAEIASICANPWQIFRPRSRRTIIDLGASGLSAVYADSALTYYIRSLLSSDSGIQYAIRNAIYKDDAVGYYLRSAISQNSEVGYVLRSAIAKDDAEAYKIRGLVQSSDAETYSIRGLVQTADSEAYKIRSQVQADTSTSYDIQSSTSVASSNAVNYSVRGAVAASVLVGYSVRGSAQRDAASAYSVRSAVSRDVAASYTVSASVASVYADSTASYSVDGVVPSGPSAESIAAAVLAALQTTTIPVDTKKMNGYTIIGDGSEADLWRGVGVQP